MRQRWLDILVYILCLYIEKLRCFLANYAGYVMLYIISYVMLSCCSKCMVAYGMPAKIVRHRVLP